MRRRRTPAQSATLSDSAKRAVVHVWLASTPDLDVPFSRDPEELLKIRIND
jgi:hypothetical protein